MELGKKRQDVETALSVLRRAKEFDRYATIAGGFPRDLYFGKEYSDVDLYIRGVEGFNTADYAHFVNLLFPEKEDFKESGSMDHWELSGIDWIYYSCRFLINDLEINLIFVKGIIPIRICDTFDFDICKFTLCPTSGAPQNYNYTDFSDKKVTMSNKLEGAQLEFSITRHYSKLKEKYPEFDFGNAEELYMKYTSKLGALL